METLNVDKNAIRELASMIEEIHNRIESLELASNPEFMKSLKKSGEEIKNGDIVSFDEL